MMLLLSLIVVVLGPLLGLLLGKIAAEELLSAERYLRLCCWILSGAILVLGVWLAVIALIRGLDVSLYLITTSLLFLDGLCVGTLYYYHRWGHETKD